MYTELDRGIATVIAALKTNNMWNDTVRARVAYWPHHFYPPRGV